MESRKHTSSKRLTMPQRAGKSFLAAIFFGIANDRLTITVGHRLSSIKGADVIFVMDQGQVVDQGRHEELLERKGKYFELVQAQL